MFSPSRGWIEVYIKNILKIAESQGENKFSYENMMKIKFRAKSGEILV